MHHIVIYSVHDRHDDNLRPLLVDDILDIQVSSIIYNKTFAKVCTNTIFAGVYINITKFIKEPTWH
jgi:hypothetical protein